MVRMTGADAAPCPLCVIDVTLPWYDVAMVVVSLWAVASGARHAGTNLPPLEAITSKPDAKDRAGNWPCREL
ncbi:hypothetical protein BEL01nite_39370 [Bradyrhizobium elkanii]|nr:hypothetical protein BEL01nite_39370 [Bradyrhizobium elkanii]